MKKTKAVSVLLTASILMSMTGCSGAKKNVIAAAEEYAGAVLEADAGDIAELMEDDDDAEEFLEEFFNTYLSREDLQEVYDFILENTTYEINKKSVKVKDKKASVEITYTMVDYLDVYDDLDDDAEIEDYLDALEDAEDNTMEIDQEIELELDKDEWIIIDDDYENTLEVYEFYQDILDLGWVPNFPTVTSEDFLNAVNEVLGDSDPYIYDCEFFFSSHGSENAVFADIDIEYSYTESAVYSFESRYDGLLTAVQDGSFTGEYDCYYDGTTGYIFFHGTSNSSDFFRGDIYGAVFLTENFILYSYTGIDSQERRDTVDAFLTSLGYPCPSF